MINISKMNNIMNNLLYLYYIDISGNKIVHFIGRKTVIFASAWVLRSLGATPMRKFSRSVVTFMLTRDSS